MSISLKFRTFKKIIIISLIICLQSFALYCQVKSDSAKIYLSIAKESNTIGDILYNAKLAMQFASYENDSLLMGDINNFIGATYQGLGSIEISIDYYLRAYELFKKMHDKNGLSNSLNNLGVSYAKTQQFDQALKYFKESLSIKQQLFGEDAGSDEHLVYYSGSYNNIGLIYDLLSEYDSALYYLEKSLGIKIQLGDSIGIGDSYNNIGIIYLNKEQFSIAEEYFLKAYEIAELLNDVGLYVNATYNLSEFYYLDSNFYMAEIYLKKCTEQAKVYGSAELMMDIFDLRSEINFETGDYKNGFLNQKQFMALKDSLINKDTETRIAQLQIIHEAQRKDEKIQILEKEKQLEIQRNEFKNTLLIILYTVLFFTLLTTFIFFRQKKRLSSANKELVKRNLELVLIDKKTTDIDNRVNKKYESSALSDDKKQQVLIRLEKLLDEEQLFLNNDLTIEIAASELSISRTYLSQIVNESFDLNFTAYINKRRINHSIQMLSDSINNKYSIAGIAEISGFHSISSFNTLFKQKTGLTPSAFRKIASDSKE